MHQSEADALRIQHCSSTCMNGPGKQSLAGLPLTAPAKQPVRALKPASHAAGLTWAPPCMQVLVEQSLLGWKEYELEVMRDLADNVVIVCSIENVDPMGVHTGDSITVAPQQTLTDKEYQRLRDASVAIIREMGVECGGSNVQLATNPETGEMVIIEMNPRVSRSSALASKATGFPIAKMAAKLAMGMTLDQIPNDITQCAPVTSSGLPACAPGCGVKPYVCMGSFPTVRIVFVRVHDDGSSDPSAMFVTACACGLSGGHVSAAAVSHPGRYVLMQFALS